MGDSKTKIHLGCGEKYLEGYVNIDFPADEHTIMKPKADILTDIRQLEYPENSIDEIRSHHLFEHFSRTDAIDLLLKWRRWLKPDGVLRIETPDFYRCCRWFIFSNFEERMQLMRHIFGSQEARWAYHLDGWGKQKFKFFLKKLGFYRIKFKKSPGVLKIFVSYIFRRLEFLRKIFGSDLYEKVSYLRLPNIEVFAQKANIETDEGKIRKELLMFSLVGDEFKKGQMLNVWLRNNKL